MLKILFEDYLGDLMKKIILFPIWKIDELENKLSEYEEKGYRVSNIKYSYLFTFKKVSPKKIDYYLSYVFARDESMMACERYVKGGRISSIFCFYSLFRTGESKEKLSFIRGARMDYVRFVLKSRLLIFLAFFLMGIIYFFLDLKIMNEYRFAAYLLFLSILFGLICYNLYGYIKQIQKCRKYERVKK